MMCKRSASAMSAADSSSGLMPKAQTPKSQTQEQEREAAVVMEDFMSGEAPLRAAGLELGADAYGGTGIFACVDLPSGFELRVPRRFLFSPKAAATTALGARLKHAGFDPEAVCIAVLAHARRSPSDAQFGAYASRLPKMAPDVSSWPTDTQAFLSGSCLGAALHHAMADLRELHGRLAAAMDEQGTQHFTVEELGWARGMMLSRRFEDTESGAALEPTGKGAWGEVGMLVPLIDMLNHNGKEECTLSVDGDDMLLCNKTPKFRGQQVFHNYGDKSNEHLLAMYGFALHNNPHDAVSLLLGAGAAGAHDEGAGKLCQIGRGGISPELWEVLVENIEDEDDDEAEEAAVGALHGALSAKLALLDAAEADLDMSELPAVRRSAIQYYRTGVRQVLMSALRECAAMVDMLEQGDGQGDGKDDEQ